MRVNYFEKVSWVGDSRARLTDRFGVIHWHDHQMPCLSRHPLLYRSPPRIFSNQTFNYIPIEIKSSARKSHFGSLWESVDRFGFLCAFIYLFLYFDHRVISLTLEFILLIRFWVNNQLSFSHNELYQNIGGSINGHGKGIIITYHKKGWQKFYI